MNTVHHYFDYKSPYAYLAQKANWELEALSEVQVCLVPYTLKIEKYLGRAELGNDGVDVVGERNDHQWRRVRYSYIDCRREANRRGLTILGPKKIFNSSLAHIAFLYVSKSEDPRRYHDAIFERFWRREFNLESYKEITGLMKELGYDAREFSAYFNGLGLKEYQLMQTEAENSGVFGVPSWRYNGELYWGLERLGLLKKNLKEQAN